MQFKNAINKYGYEKLIRGYRWPFGEIDIELNEFRYFNDSKFEYLMHLYQFDFDLRILTFKYISIIEETIKSQLSNHISMKYGTNYTLFINESNFKNIKGLKRIKESIEEDVNDIINTYNKSLEKCTIPIIKNHSIIEAYKDNDGEIPFWSISQILTLGTLTRILEDVNISDCSAISKMYNLQPNQFISYLINVYRFRNVCAHHNRLFNHKTIRQIVTTNIKDLLNIVNQGVVEIPKRYGYCKNDYLSLVISFKMLLEHDDFCSFCYELERLLNCLEIKIPRMAYIKIIDSMGLNNNWLGIMSYSLKKKK